MIRKVHLHGSLSAGHCGPYLISGSNVAEVIEGLSRQIPALQPDAKGRKRIKVVGFDSEASLYTDLGEMEDIHIVPQFSGGKNSGLTQILIGVALIGISLINPIAGTKLATMLMQFGAIMALGGLAALLAPTPEEDTGQETGNYLGGPRNTTKIGTRIPILYGEYRWGGHILSYDINALEYKGTGGSRTSGGK